MCVHRLIDSNLRIQPRYIYSRLYWRLPSFPIYLAILRIALFFLSLYWHIFIARTIHGHRELRRDRNESTLHSLPLPRFVHIKSLFDRQSNLWSGKEKSRKDTAIKKKGRIARSHPGGETENWLLMKKDPQCVCVFFLRSIFEFIFSPPM